MMSNNSMKVTFWCYCLVGADERAKSFLSKMDAIAHMVCMSHTQHKHYLANILDLLDS